MENEIDVQCPYCQNINNHIISVHVFIGEDDPKRITCSDILILKNGNLQYFNSPRQKPYRLHGISVLIQYDCEQGHSWTEEIYTHKGDCHKIIKNILA